MHDETTGTQRLGFIFTHKEGEHSVRFDDSDKVTDCDHEWISGFVDRVSYSQSQTSFSILSESWLTVSALLDAIQDVGKLGEETQQYWTVDQRGRRVIATVANFLSASVMYMDAVKASAARRFGKGSPEAKAAKEDASVFYDECAGYRICYGLRNCVLHTGILPVSISVIEDEAGVPLVKVMANRERMLNAVDWSPSGRALLNSLNSEFDLVPFLVENWEGICEFERNRARSRMEELASDIPKLQSLLALSSMRPGDVPFVGFVARVDDDLLNFGYRLLPEMRHLQQVEAAARRGDVLEAFPATSIVRDGKDVGLAMPGQVTGRLESARKLLLKSSVEGFDDGASDLWEAVSGGPRESMEISLGLMEVAYMLARLCEVATGHSIYRILDQELFSDDLK